MVFVPNFYENVVFPYRAKGTQLLCGDENIAEVFLTDMVKKNHKSSKGIIQHLYYSVDKGKFFVDVKAVPKQTIDNVEPPNLISVREYIPVFEEKPDAWAFFERNQTSEKIIEEADRKLDNLLQEHKQTAFAEKVIESAEADEKKIPLKKNIIHNIEMVVADYTSDRIAAAVDSVLISTDETDEKVLTRVVMKLLTDSKKETPTKKQKSKKKPLQTSDMVKFIIE